MVNINETMRELAQWQRMQEEAAAMVEALKDQIKEHMTAAGLEVLTGDEHKATFKTVTSSRIDTAALRKEHPDIAEQYTKTTETKRFIFA